MPAPVDGGALVGKLHGVKENAFVPRDYSMAVFSLNFSRVYCNLLLLLNKDKLSVSPPKGLIHSPLKQSIKSPNHLCCGRLGFAKYCFKTDWSVMHF